MDYLDNYIKATNTHDFSEVSKLLSKEAVYYFSDASLDSNETIKEYFENTWSLIPDEYYWASDVVSLHQDENTCVYVYQFNYKGHMNGSFIEGYGRATNVFVRENDEFKLIHEHLSVKK